ncbi:retrovirus-related pol polyprotein from transposon TNT 1-94 [Tanacetum coccineum]
MSLGSAPAIRSVMAFNIGSAPAIRSVMAFNICDGFLHSICDAIRFCWSSRFAGVVQIVLCNDQIAKIMGYGDYQLGNVIISRIYYVEGLGHDLFSVEQFCDADLEVAFRKNTCFIYNLDGVDLLSGSRDTNLYIISLDDMLKISLICLLSKASKTKTCALGKSKKSSHQPKVEDTNQEKLYLLHMDLCGPMHVASINGKSEDLGKFDAKADIGIFVGYATAKKGFRIYNKRTRKIIETIHVSFDELSALAYEQFSSGPVLNPVSQQPCIPPNRNDWDHLFQPMFDEYFNPLPCATSPVPVAAEPRAVDLADSLELVPCPNRVLLIKLKWIYKVKKDKYEGVLKNKARFIAQGFGPEEGIDFEESFASVARIKAIRIFIANAANKNMTIYQMNVKTDFLNGELREVKYGMQSTDSVDTPMVEKTSRPDLVFAVCMCTRYQAQPTEKHLHAVKRIFRYLKGTIDMGLWYLKDSSNTLTAYADADHVGCQDTRQSTSGSVQFLGDKLVSWSSKKQKSTAISSTEAKYIALSGCCAQILWMRSQLTNYGLKFNKIPIYCDNKSAITFCCNNICPRVPNQEFVDPPSEDELVSFIKELGYSGVSLGRQQDLIGSGNHKLKSCGYGALIPDGMINQDIKDSKAFKTYYDFATGKATPKKARKFKKVASPSKKLSHVLEEVPAKKGKSTFQDVALLEAAQLKKVLKKSKHDTHMGNSEDESDDVNDEDGNDDESGNDDDGGMDAHDSERTDSDDDEIPSLTLKDDEEEEYEEEYVH